LQKVTSTWNHQGYLGYSGYAWYRLRLKLPATQEALAIDIGHVNSAAEVYADGQLIGINGVMRPKPDWSEQAEANAFPLPLSLNGRWVEIAIRVWKSPVASSYSGGGFHRPPVVGSLFLLQASQRLAIDNGFFSYLSRLTVDLLSLVLGCMGLALFLLDRRNTEYAWFAVWCIGQALLDALIVNVTMHQGSTTFVYGDSQLLELPLYVAEDLFLWGFLRARRGWLFGFVILLNLIAVTGNTLGYHSVVSLPTGQVIQTSSYGLVFVLVIVRVLLSLKADNRDARLLIVPVFLLALGNITEGVRQAIYFAGWTGKVGALVFWSNGIVTVDWNDVFQALVFISIGFALISRFTHSAQEERRLATELSAARDVQSRLVPTLLPALCMARVQAVYLPATEVGGDFYQIFPMPDDSALIIIGDVSGKGLKAAMTGTLVLGALRALAQEDLSPAQILMRLNSQLVGATDGGFITCLCARIAEDGSLKVANAGHLAPYCNGMEIDLENGLPLGIAANTSYVESSLRLAPGDTLTLISDGVLEARNAAGELYGFERTAALSIESAENVAQAAKAFGQEDDITVLTLTRTNSY
jgi:Serine phosphatase RsbU, regulator of sigma subunit